jgi:hypothetical protein
MQSAVMTLDELTAGEETVGAAFHGLHPEALSCALRQLEADGRAKCVLLCEWRAACLALRAHG